MSLSVAVRADAELRKEPAYGLPPLLAKIVIISTKRRTEFVGIFICALMWRLPLPEMLCNYALHRLRWMPTIYGSGYGRRSLENHRPVGESAAIHSTFY
jgi:hypothetical protein